jgi:uncharacterized membrane protein YccC
VSTTTSPPVARPPLGWNDVVAAVMPSPRAAYVARTILAMAIAIYAALYLQLSSPASAAVTVMIVANPSRGGIVSKGVWRIFGTMTGAIAAIVILACFPQQPLMFIVAFAVWLGVCTFASSMFRHFRAYAAVLSGYTVAIIAVGAINDPSNVLNFALSRLAVVTLGVVSSTIVTMVFQPSITTDTMRAGGRAAFKGVAELMLARADEIDATQFAAERTRLAAAIERLDEAVEFSGAEAPDVNRHAASLRRGFAAMYAALMSVSIAGRSLNALARPADEIAETEAGKARQARAADLVARIRGILAEVARYQPTDNRAPGVLADHIAAVLRDITTAQNETTSVADAAVLARVHQELEQLYDNIAPFAAWREGRAPYHRGPRLTAFRDYATAMRNGTRAMLAIVLGGLFWYITAWPSGPTLLLVLGASCALLSGLPSAAAASFQFAKGIALSSVAAFIVGLVLLPYVSGYPLLFLVMSPFLVLGVIGSTIPKYALMSLGFVVFFITQVGISNEMTYNVVSFLNSSISFVLGAGATVLVFRVLLPPNPMRDARYLTRRIRRSSERLIRAGVWHPASRDWLGWLVTQNQAFQRLFMRLGQAQPAVRAQAIGDSGALILITQEALRLHAVLRGLDLPPAEALITGRALRCLGRLRRPRKAASAAVQACDALVAYHARCEHPRPALLRAAGAFRSIAALMPEAERLLALEAPFGMEA